VALGSVKWSWGGHDADAVKPASQLVSFRKTKYRVAWRWLPGEVHRVAAGSAGGDHLEDAGRRSGSGSSRRPPGRTRCCAGSGREMAAALGVPLPFRRRCRRCPVRRIDAAAPHPFEVGGAGVHVAQGRHGGVEEPIVEQPGGGHVHAGEAGGRC